MAAPTPFGVQPVRLRTSSLLVVAATLAAGVAEAAKPAIVLLHGAFEDASVWKPVQTELEKHGYKTVAVDLPGRPSNPLPPQQCSLDLYRDTVIKAIDTVGAPVVLVGHSFGGMTVSAVAEAAPDKLVKAVYLAAYLPASGDSLQTLSARDAGSKMGPNFQVDPQKLVASVKFDARGDLFCNDCTPAARAALPATMVDEPLPPPGTPVTLTSEKFGRVKKAYIETRRDQVISAPFQKQMLEAAGVKQVIELDTGHAPFISQPEALARAIERTATGS